VTPAENTLREGRHAKEFSDAVDHVAGTLFGELGLNGQRERLPGRSFALGKSAGAIPEIREALLHVHRHGIVDLRADAARLEVGLQLIPMGNTDDVLVEDMPSGGNDRTPNTRRPIVGTWQTRFGEETIVSFRVALTTGGPVVQMWQLGGHHGRLKRVEAEITADDPVVVLGHGTVTA